jgi:hypothetical protein
MASMAERVNDIANEPRRMTEAQLRAGMLFPGCRTTYEAELKRRGIAL